MILFFLLLAGNLFAQTQPTNTATTVNNTNLPGQSVNSLLQNNVTQTQVKNLLKGKPTITGTPTYQNGIVFSNTSGNAITFNDGTTQNTTPPASKPIALNFTSSISVSGLSASTFTIPSSTNEEYLLIFVATQTTSAGSDFYIGFNNDTGTNYTFVLRDDNTAANNANGSVAAVGVPLDYTGNHVQITSVLQGRSFIFTGNSDRSAFIQADTNINHPASGAAYGHDYSSGFYNSTSAITQINFRTLLGKFNGSVYLYKLTLGPT